MWPNAETMERQSITATQIGEKASTTKEMLPERGAVDSLIGWRLFGMLVAVG